ncbi:mitochondrial small ribosomal subunit Rsm22-domain-containing protein, partial [Neohortaea acidophila]
SSCASCRLRAAIFAKQNARTSPSSRFQIPRQQQLLQCSPRKSLRFSSSEARLPATSASQHFVEAQHSLTESAQDFEDAAQEQSPVVAAENARKKYRDVLPEGVLSGEELKIYERLYGRAVRLEERGEVVVGEDVGTGVGSRIGLMKEGADGELEEVEFEVEDEVVREEEELDGDDVRLAGDIENALDEAEEDHWGEEDGTEEEESYTRSHPLTVFNRFTTSPSTLSLPKSTFIDPIQSRISGTANAHLAEAAHRIFGGVGLPYSTSTPALAKMMQQKPIPLEAGQDRMSNMEGDIFMSVLMPGFYASVLSVLVETRKRLGTAWAEDLVRKAEKGELRILDAGGGGAGVLAVRELLKAEWERMHELSANGEARTAVANPDGKIGGAGLTPPMGHATVLTGSDALRHRASALLENTIFVPRLPDYLHTEQAGKKGKFDLVIAPHTLWGLREDHLRKSRILNLWNLLSSEGGVLLLLEKGIARGFEIVAAARETLLDTRFESSTHPAPSMDIFESYTLPPAKEKGMIIAPCTNQSACPMYIPRGTIKSRRDICHFSQRYVRPPFLQRILGARDKNFEDVKFSYFSAIRGRDLRDAGANVNQDDAATEEAFKGYEHHDTPPSTEQHHLSLSLPRAVLPPLKRRGHVILDLCTPAATLERWTVPRSLSRQAFRDARKSSWGDLWALGAKTRVPRVPKVKKRTGEAEREAKREAKKK